MKTVFARCLVTVVDGSLSSLEFIERAWPYFCTFLIALFITLKLITAPRETCIFLAWIVGVLSALIFGAWGCSIAYDWAAKAVRHEREAQIPKSEGGRERAGGGE